jgi:hypothetical protein
MWYLECIPLAVTGDALYCVRCLRPQHEAVHSHHDSPSASSVSTCPATPSATLPHAAASQAPHVVFPIAQDDWACDECISAVRTLDGRDFASLKAASGAHMMEEDLCRCVCTKAYSFLFTRTLASPPL